VIPKEAWNFPVAKPKKEGFLTSQTPFGMTSFGRWMWGETGIAWATIRIERKERLLRLCDAGQSPADVLDVFFMYRQGLTGALFTRTS